MHSSWASDNGGMWWRTTALEEMGWMEKRQQHCNGHPTRVAAAATNGKQQSTNSQQRMSNDGSDNRDNNKNNQQMLGSRGRGQ
jgi:hypothetical protein